MKVDRIFLMDTYMVELEKGIKFVKDEKEKE